MLQRWEIRWIRGRMSVLRVVDLRDELHQQVVDSVTAGARLEVRWCDPPGPGAYYAATVLTGVTKGMPAYHEEMFGPVAAVTLVGGDDEAIEVANDSDFGLGAAVFSGTSIAPRRWPGGSRPGTWLSTRWWLPTRGCRSVGSSSPATDGNWPTSASRSS